MAYLVLVPEARISKGDGKGIVRERMERARESRQCERRETAEKPEPKKP
jgi:hypothetical protein